jgi:hypothetical protein
MAGRLRDSLQERTTLGLSQAGGRPLSSWARRLGRDWRDAIGTSAEGFQVLPPDLRLRTLAGHLASELKREQQTWNMEELLR